MIYYDDLVKFLEVLLFSIFIVKYFLLNHQKLLIVLMTVMQWGVVAFVDDGVISNFLMMCIMLIGILISKKKLQFDDVYIVLIYMSLMVLLKVSSYFLCGFFLGMSPYLENYEMAHFIFQRGIAVTFQTAITYWLIKEKINLSTSFDFQHWHFIIGTNILFILGMTICLYAVLDNHPYAFEFAVLLSIFVWLAILFRKTINKMDKLNQKQIEYTKIAELTKFNRQKMAMFNQIKKEIEDKEHRSFYMLYLMEQFLKQKDYIQLEDTIVKYEKMLMGSKINIDTGNDIFDYFYGMKINEFLRAHTDIENCICISKNQVYNEISFIHWLNDLLDFFKECQHLKVFMNESGPILIIRIIYQDGVICADDIATFLEKTKLMNVQYNLSSHQTNGLRLTIDVSQMKM